MADENGKVTLGHLLDLQRQDTERDGRYLDANNQHAVQTSVDPSEFDRTRQPICAGYVRVSTGKQQWGLDAQREIVSRYFQYKLSATHRWFPESNEFFIDRGESARETHFRSRPAGSRIDAAVGRGDAILIAKGDRAFRDLRDQVVTMHNWIDRGVVLHSAGEGWNTGESGGRLIAQIMGIIAEQESQRLSDRMYEVNVTLRANGQPTGGQNPIGFYWCGELGKRRLTRNPHDRYVMGKIVEWHREGFTYESIYFHLFRKRIKRRPHKGSERRVGWGLRTIYQAYWMELLIRWLEREGADFTDPAVVNMLRSAVSYRVREVRGVKCTVIDDQAFKAQLEAENL